jgi:predicted secreted protein
MIPLEQQPKDPKDRKPLLWKGSQGLELKSKNSEQLLKLMGELQEIGFQASGLNYTLSPESFESIRDAMMETALKKLTAKARAAAQALGKSDAELVEVSVDTGNPYQPPMPMMARAEMGGAMAKDMAAPVASPGESEITLTVSARAILK